MVIVGASAETAATDPKDLGTVVPATVVVRVATAVRGTRVRTGPADRTVDPGSGVTVTTAAVTIGETTVVEKIVAETTAVIVAVTVGSSRVAAVTTVVAPAVLRTDVAARADSDPHGDATTANTRARSGVTPAPTNRTSPTRWNPVISTARSGATC